MVKASVLFVNILIVFDDGLYIPLVTLKLISGYVLVVFVVVNVDVNVELFNWVDVSVINDILYYIMLYYIILFIKNL